MTQQRNSKFMAHFQQIFALFCVLMTKICIFLFFLTSASKSHPLLITSQVFRFYSVKYHQTFDGKSRPIFRKSKPNPAKKLFLWRYSDTRNILVLKAKAAKIKPSQTWRLLKALIKFPSPIWRGVRGEVNPTFLAAAND
jgi:hypothetical protein